MTTTTEAIEIRQAFPSTGPKVQPSMQRPIELDAEWLRQAREVRDQALCLLRERFTKDLESAIEILDGRSPEALACEVEYASRLLVDYQAKAKSCWR